MAATTESDESLKAKASKLFNHDDPTPYLQLINNLFSTDTTLRSNAVPLHNIIKKYYRNAHVLKLAHLLHTSHVNTTRKRCAILLHRLLSAPDHDFRSLGRMTQTTIKTALLCCLRNEQVQETLEKICKAVSEIASDLLPKYQWDDLFHLMFSGLSSDTIQQKQCSLLLFAELIPKCPEFFIPRVDLLYESFIKLMVHLSDEYGVLAAGTRASVNLILYLTTPTTHEKYYEILACIVRALSEVSDDEDDKNTQIMLKELIILGGTRTNFLKMEISYMFEAMLEISKDCHLTEKTRQLAIELVITVAEDKESGCVLIQRFPNRIKLMIKMLMGMLASINDDPEWGDANNDDNNAGESSMCSYAMKSISRLANALGGNSIVTDFQELFPQFSTDLDWKKRHAAATTLSLLSKGCSKVLVNHMSLFVDTVLKLVEDPHPRVRWAAINVVGQFSKDLSPNLQEEFHQRLIPALSAALYDFANPRIQVRAATALRLFSHSCSSNILKPHLKSLVKKLLMFFQKGNTMLIEAALPALGTLAESCQGDFEEYYDAVVLYVKFFFNTAINDASRMLVAKYLECITMVGLAVGRRKFPNDVHEVAKVALLLEKSVETNNPGRIHVLQAWGRLCKCLGSEFLPFVKVAVPQLLQSAEIKNYMSETENEEIFIDDSDDESMAEVTTGNGKVRIKVSVIEEKAVACNMLCSIVAELKEELRLWIYEIVHALAPLIGFKFHDDIKASAISAMPLIFKSAVSATVNGLSVMGFGNSPVIELSDIIFPALLDALNKELNMEINERILEALNECVQIIGTRLSQSQVTRLIDGIIEFLSNCSYQKSERETRVEKGLDMRPKEMLKEEIEQEERIYAKVADYLGTFIGIFKASFLPFFDKVLPCIALMLGKNKRARDGKILFRIFRDVAEQCRDEAFRYYETSLLFVFKACDDDDPDVQQVVARAIGLCAEFGGKAFEPHVEEGISSLQTIIEHPRASELDDVLAHEAAVSALGMICTFHSKQLKSSEVVNVWLSHLPIKADLVQAKIVHEQLCSMVEMSDNKVTGLDVDNTPRIIKIFAEIAYNLTNQYASFSCCIEILWAGNNLATAETVNRIIKLLKQFHRKVPLFALESVYSSLPLPQENMIRSILSS